MNIAWTYALHAYYREANIEYRYFDQLANRKKFHRTRRKAYKYWSLEDCLDYSSCPLSKEVVANLKFLIGLRHEIEHQMTRNITDLLSGRFQACCLNFNAFISDQFGNEFGIEKHLSFSLQFSTLSEEQVDMLEDHPELQANIKKYILEFDHKLEDDIFNSPSFSYRVLFVPKTANHKGQADRVIEFVKSDSPLAKGLIREYALIKETERPKYIPLHIVKKMQELGYAKFNMHAHTMLWQSKDARNASKGYGTWLNEGRQWQWYESWLKVVEEHCKENANKYRE